MRRAVPRLVLLLAVGALVIAACGDDSGGTAASSSTAAGGSTTAARDGTTVAGDTTAPPTTTPGSSSDIEELLGRYRRVPLRTTYLSGEGDARTEMTFSQDPTADPPVSAMISAEGKAIFLADSMIFCSAEGEGAQCFEMPAEGGSGLLDAMFSPWAMLAMTAGDPTATTGFDVETDQFTIAGRSGICFTFRPDIAIAGETEFVRQCVDGELGFTLLLEVKEVGAAAVERVMELIAVGEPEEGDFEPTGPVMPLATG